MKSLSGFGMAKTRWLNVGINEDLTTVILPKTVKSLLDQ